MPSTAGSPTISPVSALPSGALDIETVRQRCIKVFGTDNQSHIIDVGTLHDAKAIRERVFKKFGILGSEEKQMYGLFGLDFSGVLDTEHALDDTSLLEICQSPNTHLKGHLVLKKLAWYDFGADIVPTEAQSVVPQSRSGDASPIDKYGPLIPSRTDSFNSGNSDVEGPEAKEAGKKKMKHQQSLRRLRSFFSSSTSNLVEGGREREKDKEKDKEQEKEKDRDTVPVLRPPPPRRRSRIVPPPPPTPSDTGRPMDFLMEPPMRPRDRMTLSSASSLPMAVPRVTAKRLERFFGERPPSEMICDNLEQFFPGIQDMDVEVITENDAESVAGEEGEIVPIDDTGFIFDSTGSVSGTLKRMRHRSVKQMVEENILVKRLSRSSGPSGGLGGTNTSFGRRLSRVVGQPMRPGVSRAATIDGVGAVSGLAGSRSVREEWRDRIASIDEEGSILTGRNAEWAPLPVPVAAQLGVGSDGELDKESGRRKSFASLRRQALLPAGVSEVLPGESSEARGSVLMEEHRGPGHNLTRRKSDGDIASTKCRGISIAELKELAASSAELASGSRKMENELKSGSSKPSDSLPHSIRSIRLRPSQESLAGSARKSLRVRISQEALRTSNSRTSFHRYSTETLSHESLDESGSKSLSDVASVKSFSSNLSQSPSASASIGSLPRRPTLARAFTHAPDTPRSVDWIKGDLIGSGSFGRVYYGVNVLTGEIMAVKQVELADARSLPPKAAVAGGGIHALRKRMVDALHQEITLLKDLNHENIVRYLGYDVQGNMINVFLEYVSGGSVASSLSKMGSFEEELVRSISCQVLSGLEYLHERSIIHRDIKGGNILLDENGVAKISDFGISKKNEYKMAYRYNSRMSIQGSVYWMAPEVIKAKGYSAKVDIWSLGCVVLEMFTGGNPWKQLDELQTMWRLGRENTPPIPDDLSDDGKRFIEKCFTIDPDQRPTATQMLMDRFADVDPAEFDFKSCKERAIERLRQEEEEDDLDFEGSWIGTDISTLPEMLEEVGGTSSGLGSRMSILERRRRGSGMPIARVASAKMMDGLSLGVGLRRKSERKSGLRLETGFSDSDGTGSELNSASTTGGRGSVVATDQIGEGTEGELTPLTGTTCIGTAGLGRETAPGEGKSKPDVGEEPAKAVFVVGDDDHDSDAVA